MAYENDILTRNDNDELAVRTVQSVGDNPASSYDDVYTRDNNGKLAVRVVGSGGGGGDQHNLGWYADLTALQTAHPTGSDGDFAILGSTDTVWVWDSDTSAWKDTDTKGQVTSVNGQTGDVVIPNELPSQTGQSGKFLTTDGTDASWSDKPLVNEATGTNSLTIFGTPTTQNGNINIGSNSAINASPSSGNNILIGTNTKLGSGLSSNVTNTVLIGTNSQSPRFGGGVAIGADTYVYDVGMAAGWKAESRAGYAIQLGRGVNSTANTFSVGLSASNNYRLLDSDGTIPTARLTKVNTTVTLTAAGWSSNTQTVSVTGVSATGVVMVSPAPADQSAYTSAGVLCTAQAAGSLTFTCDTVPSGDIDVNVVML